MFSFYFFFARYNVFIFKNQFNYFLSRFGSFCLDSFLSGLDSLDLSIWRRTSPNRFRNSNRIVAPETNTHTARSQREQAASVRLRIWIVIFKRVDGAQRCVCVCEIGNLRTLIFEQIAQTSDHSEKPPGVRSSDGKVSADPVNPVRRQPVRKLEARELSRLEPQNLVYSQPFGLIWLGVRNQERTARSVCIHTATRFNSLIDRSEAKKALSSISCEF